MNHNIAKCVTIHHNAVVTHVIKKVSTMNSEQKKKGDNSVKKK
jgi:hypothetical protein